MYLEDITVLPQSTDQHILYVCAVLSHLRKAGIKLNLNEYNVFAKMADYFENVILPESLEFSDLSTDAFHDLKPSMNVAKLRLFLWVMLIERLS